MISRRQEYIEARRMKQSAILWEIQMLKSIAEVKATPENRDQLRIIRNRAKKLSESL